MDHIRDHRSLLAGAEKRLLIRLARRLPLWVTSDHLSGLALLAMLAAGPAFAAISHTPLAAAGVVALLAVNWFGDSLDGTLARVRNQQRPRYGYYVDHVIDLAGTAALMAGIAASGLMTPAVAFALLAVYFMVSAESFLGTHSRGVFTMSFAGFGPTELRIVLAIGALRVANQPSVTLGGVDALLFDVGGVIAIAGLLAAFVAAAIRNSVALYQAEPLPRRDASSRGLRFLLVGVAGFILQLAVLAILTHVARWPWLLATVVAVELAIVHNYVWHERWTWKDRFAGYAGIARFAGFVRFVRFNLSAALTSIFGNVLLMALFVGVFGMPVVLANVVAVGVVSLANFALADRWVFVASLLLLAPVPASAAPKAETIDAWTRYVAAAETKWDRALTSPCDGGDGARDGIVAWGETVGVDSGTISDWRGTVFIPHTTVEQLIGRLQHPGTPPPQEDVTASRVLARGPDSLRVYMRLVRQAIVTVSYDTEHEMTFRRWSPTLAAARSISTKISEVGGGDHGFLWKLNSYWRYQQSGSGVLVSVESLTLSRDVPAIIRPLAGRLVPRIARESMIRTLEALRRYFE